MNRRFWKPFRYQVADRCQFLGGIHRGDEHELVRVGPFGQTRDGTHLAALYHPSCPRNCISRQAVFRKRISSAVIVFHPEGMKGFRLMIEHRVVEIQLVLRGGLKTDSG